MNLILVGASGFIGRNFLKLADLSKYNVTATYNSEEDFPQFLKQINPSFIALKYNSLKDEVDFSKFDVAIYLAGNANHGWAGLNPDFDLEMNGVAMSKFLKHFRGRLIYFSSGAVYFGKKGAVSPRVVPDPHFPYAISKLSSELYIKWARESGLIKAYTIIRFYYAYGPGEEDRRLIRKVLTEFGSGNTKFIINGNGKSLMSPMHVEDVARALEMVMNKESEGVYDLPANKNYKVIDIVKLAAKVSGIKPVIELKPTNETPLLFFSSQLDFSKTFDFSQKYDLENGLRHYQAELRDGKSSR